jgi:predicted nucleic acid-binding Zn ribbon protein
MTKCNNCGTDNIESNRYCQECGNKLDNDEKAIGLKEKEVIMRKEKSRKKTVIAVVGLPLIFIFIVALIIVAGSNNINTATENSTNSNLTSPYVIGSANPLEGIQNAYINMNMGKWGSDTSKFLPV